MTYGTFAYGTEAYGSTLTALAGKLPLPELAVEFDAGTWTDLYADMVDVGTSRGRNRELGAFQTGTINFTVRNDTRKYDPDNTAGPFYGKLRPNRRVRFRATYNGTTYPVYQGYLDRISQVYGGPNDATAVFQASDIFKLLNRVELPASVYAAEVATDAPPVWFKLDETSSSASTVAANSGTLGSAADGTYVGPVSERGLPSIPDRDPGTAIRVQDAGGFVSPVDMGVSLAASSFNLASYGSWAVEFWVRPADTPIGVDYWVLGRNLGFAIQSSSSGAAERWTFLLLSNTPTQYGVTGTAAGQVPNERYHIVAKYGPSQAMAIYVNGTKYTTTAAASTAPPLVGPLYGIGDLGFLYTFGANQTPAAIADEFAIYTADAAVDPLPDARVTAHYQAGITPWNGDLPGIRLGRILDLAAVPTADRNIDSGVQTLQSTSLGSTALAYAQKIEETDLGELFIARDGKVRFLDRNSAVTGGYLTSQFTLVDDDSGAGIPYRNVAGDVDEAVLITRATASRAGSVAVSYYDAAAKAEFGWLDETHDGLLHNSDAYSAAYAQWIVNTHKTPGSRVGTVRLELTANPTAMYPAVLALEIGDRVTYKRKPQNTGAVITIDMRVEAVTHDHGAGYWRTSLQLSPFNLAGGQPVGVWDVTLWDQSVWGI